MAPFLHLVVTHRNATVDKHLPDTDRILVRFCKRSLVNHRRRIEQHQIRVRPFSHYTPIAQPA